MNTPKIRVLVIDDHPIVRFGLCTQINLDSEMQVVAEAVDGIEGVQMANLLHPDVILMDLVMPRLNGVDAITAILKENPKARILVLTSFTEDERIYAAIQAGALGFLNKDTTPDEMLQAIRDVFLYKPVLNPTFTRRILAEIQNKKESQAEISFTPRELQIIELVATGMLYKEIASKMAIHETTVRTHVSHILRKVNLENRSQLVLYSLDKKKTQFTS